MSLARTFPPEAPLPLIDLRYEVALLEMVWDSQLTTVSWMPLDRYVVSRSSVLLTAIEMTL